MHETIASLGRQLRHARERRGLTLADVATTTKIGTRTLAAIEQEEFRRLPGGIFRRAYVKAYADAVGLDGEGLARAYVTQFEPPPPPPAPPPPSRWAVLRQRPAGVPSGALALLCAVLVGAVALQERRSAGPGDAPAAPLDVRQARLEDAATDATMQEPALEVTPAALQLVIEATAECWVSAVADGERVIHRLVEPGESLSVDASTAVTIRVGNAGAVVLTINGMRARSLGDPGEVATIHVTPDNYDAMLPAGQRVARGPDRHAAMQPALSA